MKLDLHSVLSVLALGLLSWGSFQVYHMNASVSLISYKVEQNHNMIKPMWQDFLIRSSRYDQQRADEVSSLDSSGEGK